MAEIASHLGRTACLAIGGFVQQCQTGEAVENIGYCTAALILLVFGISAFLKRVA
jgi:hypothetical protein